MSIRFWRSAGESLDEGKQYLIGNYARLPIVMARGQGSRLWDSDGKEYLDLFAGFGRSILGHCHPDLIRAASEQAQRLWHVGNTFYTAPQIEFGPEKPEPADRSKGLPGSCRSRSQCPGSRRQGAATRSLRPVH